MSAIDSIFSRDFSFRRGGKKEEKREEKLVCLLQLGNEMFARETIVGGTMVGGVTARGWKYVVRANGPLDRPLIG